MIKKILVTILFACFLAAPAILKKNNNPHPASSLPQETKSELLDTYGLYFEDVSKACGINFIHQSPLLDPRLKPILPQIASMGAAAAVGDFDRDGWNDIYVTNSRENSRNALYHNQKDGTFREIAEMMNVADVNRTGTGVSMGSVWGDYDNDGYEDLFIYKWGKSELYKNLGGKEFKIVTGRTGIPEWANANTSIWFDYNSDGYLDLFIGCYFREDIDLWNLKSTVIMPESFEYANNGGRNYLLRNNGNGSFEDVTDKVGITSTKWTLAAGALDINRDGYQDLVVANDYSVSEIFINRNGEFFEERGKELGIGFAPKSGMNASFGDVDNKGDFGVYISNISEMGILLQGNNFWVPSRNGSDLVYTNMARQKGIELGGWSYSAQFGDLNNDGSQDLYVANGYISGTRGTSYWYDYTKVTSGNKSIISDVTNWPDMRGRSQSGYQNDVIWLNDGSGNFMDVAGRVSPQFNYDGRAVAFADLWNRGALDVIVTNQNNRLVILKNFTRPGNHWIDFELEGKSSNKGAIGAIIELHWDGKIQSQVITGGIGFCSQNQRRMHFGLGESARAEQAVIHWPSGKIQTLNNIQSEKINYITEPD